LQAIEFHQHSNLLAIAARQSREESGLVEPRERLLRLSASADSGCFSFGCSSSAIAPLPTGNLMRKRFSPGGVELCSNWIQLFDRLRLNAGDLD
jgi:hypothetical protein